MGFYEDMEKSLLEANEMEKGNIPLVPRKNMPAATLFSADKEKELVNEHINMQKNSNAFHI